MLKIIRQTVFLIVTLMVFVCLAELCIRGYFYIKNIQVPRRADLDRYLGWRSLGNIHYKEVIKGYGEIEFSTTEYGFRVFGDINSNKTKIFVIGDSFTEARTVSDGQTYYDYLKDNGFEIFAYGCGGYGTLQEYMVLAKYYDLIKPDIILWQFCGNDIINNSFELESSSRDVNNYMVRPYYRDGQIKYLYPHSSWIYRNILRHSYFIKLCDIQLGILSIRNPDKTDLELLSRKETLLKRALSTTSELMGLVRRRVGDTSIVAFTSDSRKPFLDIFSDICNQHDIKFIFATSKALQEARESGMIIDGSPRDSHFNNLGHAILGRAILNYLIENKLVDNSGSEPTLGTSSKSFGRLSQM